MKRARRFRPDAMGCLIAEALSLFTLLGAAIIALVTILATIGAI